MLTSASFFALAGVPAAHLFNFLPLLEFQQPDFLIFQACWSSSNPIFLFFSLAGVPAARLFDFLALLEFQQAIFLIFRVDLRVSSPAF